MRLDEYLAGKADVRDVVVTRLDAMAAHGAAVDDHTPAALVRMRENLRDDHRPPEDVWGALCGKVSVCADVPSTCVAIRDWGRTPDFAFLIPVTCLTDESILCYVVTVDDFCRWLAKRAGYRDETEARNALRDLLTRGDVDEQSLEFWGVPVREAPLVWATFNSDDSQQDPCGCMPNEAATVCACLALDKRSLDKELLALRYRLPGGISPWFPTVVAAAASRGWNEHWRPADEGEPHGWTEPWPGYGDTTPCPEVVHERITGECMVYPIRTIPV